MPQSSSRELIQPHQQGNLGLNLSEVFSAARCYPLGVEHREDGWALAEDTCKFLGAFIRYIKPKMVLEFGSGLSSVVIGSELRTLHEGILYSFDHLQLYQAATQRIVTSQKLEAWVKVYRCPIRPCWHCRKLLLFYQIANDIWKEIKEVDLVLVDGPPYYWGREAAMYTVFPRLKIGGCLLLDDAGREAEQRYIGQWSRYYGEALECVYLEDIGKGIALFQKKLPRMAGQPFRQAERFQATLDTLKTGYRNRRRINDYL